MTAVPLTARVEVGTDQDQLAANIAGDALGLPGGLGTHFTSEAFARSALPDILPHVREVYPAQSPLRVISLCGGEAFYERVVCGELQQQGWESELHVVDLQTASLERIRESRFPVYTVNRSVAELPFGTQGTNEYGGEESPTLVLSRAYEHYLPLSVLAGALNETGRVLRPGELYAAQLTSGDPITLGALSAAVQAVANKDVSYMSPTQYLNILDTVRHEDGSPVFAVRGQGQADTQTGRGVTAQATRYLNDHFINLYSADAGPDFAYYQSEVADITATKQNLEHQVHSGVHTKETASQLLNNRIEHSRVFTELFRPVYVDAVMTYLDSQDSAPQRGTTIVHGADGSVQDVVLDIEYPIFVLERQAPNSRRQLAGQSAGVLATSNH